MDFSKLTQKQLSNDTEIKPFKCAEADLNGFRFFTEQDKDDDTRLMFFDLKNFV